MAAKHSLDERFKAAVSIVQNIPKEGPLQTSNEQKLKFYALFKQASIGDVNTARPGFFNLVEKAKWDSWKSVEGTSQEEAKEKYIEALLAMFDDIDASDNGINVGAWLSGSDLDPSIKSNLTILGKVFT